MGSGNCIPLSRPPEYSEAGGAQGTSSISADFDSTHRSPPISVIFPSFELYRYHYSSPMGKESFCSFSYVRILQEHVRIASPSFHALRGSHHHSCWLMLLGLKSGKMDRTYLLGTTCSPRHWSLTSQWPGENFSVRVAMKTYQTVTQQILLVALRDRTNLLKITQASHFIERPQHFINHIVPGPQESAKCRRRLHFPLARPRKRPMHKLKKSPSKSLLRMSIEMTTIPGLSGWVASTLAWYLPGF